MDGRKLQAWASLAEVISAVAIVVSLLYVAYEFRRTSTLSSREADVALFERVQEANRQVIENAGLAAILVEARTGPEGLSQAERLRFLAYQHDFFDSWEMGWQYHVDGILDGTEWSEWDEWFAAEARNRPPFGWTENRHNYTGEDFRRHVDSAMAAN